MKRALTLLAIAFAARGQSFDVASIKPNRSGRRGGSMEFAPGGERFTAVNVPLGALILTAYDITVRQLAGPGDLLSEPYDVAAKAGRPAGAAEMQRMIRALLADRFKLVARDEIREAPAYVLTVGKGGPKLHAANAPAPPVAAPRNPFLARGEEPASGHLVFRNETMPDFAWALSRVAAIGDRVVVDGTGLAGSYDFELTFERAGDGPDIFSAIREQLGLKLEARKAPVRFITVEHLERPSQN